MTKTIPSDIFKKYIYKDENVILVKDPKHSNDTFHYTIWDITGTENIKCITKKTINNIKECIWKVINNNNLFDINKIQTYFTYPPTHNRLHLHIVPDYYISYRPLEELYHLVSDPYESENLIDQELSVDAYTAKIALQGELLLIRN